jgi:hypothetical protein
MNDVRGVGPDGSSHGSRGFEDLYESASGSSRMQSETGLDRRDRLDRDRPLSTGFRELTLGAGDQRVDIRRQGREKVEQRFLAATPDAGVVDEEDLHEPKELSMPENCAISAVKRSMNRSLEKRSA